MQTRRGFLKGVAVAVTVIAGAPKGLFAAPIDTFTRPLNHVAKSKYLKVEVCVEAAIDLRSVNGLDAKTELYSLLEDELAREIGSERGTLRAIRRIDPYTFQPMIGFIFRTDSLLGRKERWGLDFEDLRLKICR